MNRRDDLWVKVIRSKYKCGNDLVPIIDHKRLGSNNWLDIRNNWNEVMNDTSIDYVNKQFLGIMRILESSQLNQHMGF